jgi:DNA-binding transcriptional MerR regulator
MAASPLPGEVADKTGLSIDTLRYDERIGLLAHIGRSAGRPPGVR